MEKQKFHSWTPGQTAISINLKDAIYQNLEETQNESNPICIKSKSHPKEIDMEKKENLASESFWKEALKVDNFLFWIAVHSKLASEG